MLPNPPFHGPHFLFLVEPTAKDGSEIWRRLGSELLATCEVGCVDLAFLVTSMDLVQVKGLQVRSYDCSWHLDF